VAAQEWDDCFEVSYVMLYAFQGGQTVRGLRAGAHFNCIVNNYGWHQGDIEWVSVLVDKNVSKIFKVGFYAHGDATWYDPGQCDFEGAHPVVRVALNGHPARNGFGKNDNDWIYTYELPDIMGTVDIITRAGAQWRAFNLPGGLVPIGLDEQDNPVNAQHWVKFYGRMGGHFDNKLTGATDVDGHTGLSGTQWSDVVMDNAVGKLLDKLPAEAVSGDGPWGLAEGGRAFTRVARRYALRIWNFNSGFTSFTCEATPGIASFGGQFHCFFKDRGGNGLMHIVSPDGVTWSGSPVFHPDFTTSDGPRAVEWQNALHVFFRDGNGNGLLHVYSNDGVHVQAAQNWYLGINIDSPPSAAVLNDTVCVVGVDHGGNGIMRAVSHGQNQWNAGYTGWNTNPGTAPGIAAYNGQFHVFFQDHNGNGLMHVVSNDGLAWTPSQVFHPEYKTSAGPTAVVFEGQLHVFFRDADGNGILHASSTDGVNFSTPINSYTGMNGDGAPSAAANGNTLCVLATDAGGHGIMRTVVVGSGGPQFAGV
jgi:catechol 2,3-dioxygenase-like lactoylglutathione lyase family enzyme